MIALSPSCILDELGNPIPKKAKPRPELADAFAAVNGPRRAISGSYDAVRPSVEFDNYWANADALDADSANSRAVRSKLVQRSRYETGNNGYADGITSTIATDIVGKGPSLRMQTGSENFNRMVEREWNSWAKQVKLRRKLWCMAHAYDQDGEAFAVLRQNKRLKHRVKLDLALTETEQCQSEPLAFNEKNRIDGIDFDDFGNAIRYHFLTAHPGSDRGYSQKTESVAAKFVCHWFRMKRPGQHRGVPAGTSTLNLGAAARRWREATVAAAENIADFSLFIKTQFQPEEMDSVSPMSTLDIQKRMMTALPMGYDAFQPKAEQPTANHAEFNKTLISEQSRPRSMPYNKAACDSANHNFASGKLDHIPYYAVIDDVDREDCNDLVLGPIFEVWFEYAVIAFGWLGGNPDVLSEQASAHVWDWPKHAVADEKSEAQARDTKLKNGSTSLVEIANDSGKDYEDQIAQNAMANGITVDQQRQINLLVNTPQHLVQAVASVIGLNVPTGPSQPSDAPNQTETQNDEEADDAQDE